MFLECHYAISLRRVAYQRNGKQCNDMEHDDVPIKYYRLIPFKKLYKMYGDYIEMDFASCCVCRIPKEWK